MVAVGKDGPCAEAILNFKCRRTEFVYGAVFAVRLAGCANLPAMPDQQVRQQTPLFDRNQCHQIFLDHVAGVSLVGRKLQPVR